MYQLICRLTVPKTMTYAMQMKCYRTTMANAAIPGGYVNAIGHKPPLPFDPESLKLSMRVV